MQSWYGNDLQSDLKLNSSALAENLTERILSQDNNQNMSFYSGYSAHIFTKYYVSCFLPGGKLNLLKILALHKVTQDQH